MIVPLTQDLLERFHGKPPARTVRGYAWVEGEAVLCVFGVYPDRENKRWCVHCDVKPELRARRAELAVRREVVRAVRLMRELLSRTPGHIHVAPQRAYPRAEAFLEYVGFEPLTDDVWGWK